MKIQVYYCGIGMVLSLAVILSPIPHLLAVGLGFFGLSSSVVGFLYGLRGDD